MAFLYRLFIIVLVGVYSTQQAFSQTTGDLSGLQMDPSAEDFDFFLKMAREDGDSSKVVIIKALRGSYLTKILDYSGAEKELMECLAYIKQYENRLKTKIGNNSIYDTYDYLGNLYREIGSYRLAFYYYEMARGAKAKRINRGEYSRIMNVQNTAELFLKLDRFDSSEFYFKQLYKELEGSKYASSSIINSYRSYFDNMAIISIDQGKDISAESFIRTREEIELGNKGLLGRLKGGHSNNPNVVLHWCRLLILRGDFKTALDKLSPRIGWIKESIKSGDYNLNSEKWLANALKLQAICLNLLGNKNSEAIDAAFAMLELNIKITEHTFNSLSEDEKAEAVKGINFGMNLSSNILLSSIQQDASISKHYLPKLLEYRLKTKALLLNNSRKIQEFILKGSNPQLTKDFARLSLLKNNISKEVTRKKEEKRLNEMIAEAEALERSLSKQMASLNTQSNASVSLKDIQKKLDSREVAVEIIRINKLKRLPFPYQQGKSLTRFAPTDSIAYLALIITPETVDYAIVNSESEFEKRIAKSYSVLIYSHPLGMMPYTNLWKPIENKFNLPNTKRIFLSGDGIYNNININTLHDGKEYLIDKYDITLVTNLRDLLKQPPATSLSEKTAAFFGRPSFNTSDKTTLENKKTSLAMLDGKGNSPSRALRSFSLQDIKTQVFDDLPGTEIEVKLGAKALSENGWVVNNWIENDATEKNVKSVKSPGILHIATHGFFSEGDFAVNPMLRSGLILAGVKDTKDIDGEDGILTAYEASSLSLENTSLVVLSACETGLGEVKPGEGVYGLQRAFQIAGAKFVIMSLWKVNDAATQELMTAFYRNYAASGDVRSSFNAAQKQLRKSKPESYFWGSFVLIGN